MNCLLGLLGYLHMNTIEGEKSFEAGVDTFKSLDRYSYSLHFQKISERQLSIFLTHSQMIDLRDTLTKAIAESPEKCDHPNCEEAASIQCENCERCYCADHCTKGGDIEGGTNPNGSPYGAYAVPANCAKCRERVA